MTDIRDEIEVARLALADDLRGAQKLCAELSARQKDVRDRAALAFIHATVTRLGNRVRELEKGLVT